MLPVIFYSSREMIKGFPLTVLQKIGICNKLLPSARDLDIGGNRANRSKTCIHLMVIELEMSIIILYGRRKHGKNG